METTVDALSDDQRATYEQLLTAWPGHDRFPRLEAESFVTCLYFADLLAERPQVQAMRRLVAEVFPCVQLDSRYPQPTVAYVPTIVAAIFEFDQGAVTTSSVPFAAAAQLWRRPSDDDGWNLSEDWDALQDVSEESGVDLATLVETAQQLLVAGTTVSAAELAATAAAVLVAR